MDLLDLDLGGRLGTHASLVAFRDSVPRNFDNTEQKNDQCVKGEMFMACNDHRIIGCF